MLIHHPTVLTPRNTLEGKLLPLLNPGETGQEGAGVPVDLHPHRGRGPPSQESSSKPPSASKSQKDLRNRLSSGAPR